MASTIPAVLDALVARWRLALPGVEVIDGEPVKTPEQDTVCVGCTAQPGSGVPVVQNTLDLADMSAGSNNESYDVTCVAASWGGDSDTKPVRDRAFGLLDAVSKDVARDPRLGGLVMLARMSTESYTQEQTTKGPVAAIQFVVHIEAFAR